MPFIPYIYILHCLAIAHNSSVFLPIGNSGDYYLEIMTLMHFIMIPIFSGKMGLAATLVPKSLGPQAPTRKLVTEWNFWVNRYLKNLFSKI